MEDTVILRPERERRSSFPALKSPAGAAAAPRLYVLPTLEGLEPQLCANAARLHFNWIDLPLTFTAAMGQLEPWLDAAHTAGLSVMLALDASQIAEEDPHEAALALGERLATTSASGIRLYAANRRPAAWWPPFIAAARAHAPALRWAVDAIGSTAEDTAKLLRSGFDWYLSSSRWWNLRDDWAIDQYDRFRACAGALGFPENLAGERLCVELARNGITTESVVQEHYRLRYAIAAFFDDGVMMPMGFERAAAGRETDVRDGFDLRPQITAINRIKAAYFGAAAGLPQQHLDAGGAAALLRREPGSAPATCFLANPTDHGITVDFSMIAVREELDLAALRDVTPDGAARLLDQPLWLEPRSWRFFVRPAEVPPRERVRRALPRERRLATPGSQPLPQLRGGRIAIEHIEPALDGGRYPIKRVVGDWLEVRADIFRDGHDILGAALLLRGENEEDWHPAPMRRHENDRWIGAARVTANGRALYCIEAWTDRFATARDRLAKNYDAGQDVALEIEECRALLLATKGAPPEVTQRLKEIAQSIAAESSLSARIDRLMAPETEALMAEWGPRRDVTRLARELEVVVDRNAARFAAWYEIFPRSQGTASGQSATFRDCIARLDAIRSMGFDVVYLVPIHPIGEKNRKGRNNSLAALAGDPGSPYAIGSAAGGHCAVHPALGTLEDFRAFVAACRTRGMEVALDFAVQAAPDHPWIAAHPEWFEFRPDGSIQFAENPPKKYQDIVNFNFNSPAWPELWAALRDVVLFWVEQGVRIFRVDNPHTKPFPFWEWLIREVQAQHADTIFLAEAFTRPKVMEELAKLGFTQSYTYFTWRNEKQEIVDYFTHLTRDEPREYFRPHLFANTPDILPRFLQEGGPPAFRIRAVLAATLGGLFGIYNGFELCENRALPHSEEYRDSEKYELKAWDWDRPGNIKPLITRLNQVRHENIAFEDWRNLEFLPCDNPNVVFYARLDLPHRNYIFVAVSLDPFSPQAARIDLPFHRLGFAEAADYRVEDLLLGRELIWVGRYQQLWLDPDHPALVARVTRPGIER